MVSTGLLTTVHAIHRAQEHLRLGWSRAPPARLARAQHRHSSRPPLARCRYPDTAALGPCASVWSGSRRGSTPSCPRRARGRQGPLGRTVPVRTPEAAEELPGRRGPRHVAAPPSAPSPARALRGDFPRPSSARLLVTRST